MMENWFWEVLIGFLVNIILISFVLGFFDSVDWEHPAIKRRSE